MNHKQITFIYLIAVEIEEQYNNDLYCYVSETEFALNFNI